MSKFWTLFFHPPVRTRHFKRTLVFSPDDDPGQPSAALIDLALRVIREAMHTELREVSARMPAPPYWPDQWPGEHYRLLAAFVRVLQPKKVIEIGTHTGLSALSLRRELPADGILYTFDVVPWNEVPGTCLRAEDFQDGRMVQVIADLKDPEAMAAHAKTLENAPLVFVDGPKDRVFEPRFLENLAAVRFDQPPYLVFDDIKDWNMLKAWREIRAPKLDLTSFGHWTGTGLVQGLGR